MKKVIVKGPVDGNIFAVQMAVYSAMKKQLKSVGEVEAAMKKMRNKINEEAVDYNHALRIIMEFADFDL